MSAAPEVIIEKLGIIAGGGELPRRLLAACEEQNIEPFVVAFEGQTDTKSVEGVEHFWTRLGATGAVIKRLKQQGIEDLVLIGGIRRPALKELKPDLKTAEFFAKEGLNAIGDDGLLKALRRFLEKEGFQIHGAQTFMPRLSMPLGVIGRHKPSKQQRDDIQRGIDVLTAMAPLDIGQAVVVQQGYVLGVEAAEGTDALIKRCATLQRKGSGAVLVKLAKAGQDEDLDLPTIGPQTLENIIAAGFSGVAVHAGKSNIHDIDSVKELADQHKIFVTGIMADE